MLLLGSITIIFFFPNFYSSRDETISEKSNIQEEGDLDDNDSSSDLELLESALDLAPDTCRTPFHTLDDVMIEHKRKLVEACRYRTNQRQ